MQLEGRVTAIVVSSRVTGQTRRHPVLEASDGQRFLLRNADTLPEGAIVSVTGRGEGRVLFSESVRTLAAPPAQPKAASPRQAMTGTLRMFHVDYTDGRPAEFGYSLVDDGGRMNIVDLATLLPMLENGMRATVSGSVDTAGYIVVDRIEILAPPAPKPSRVPKSGGGLPAALTTSYITIPLKYPIEAAAPFTYNADPSSWPIATITNTVYGATPAQSVAEYFKEVSFGAQQVSGLVANAGGAWLKANVARPTDCSGSAQNVVLNSINTQGAGRALDAGYDVNNYTGILYVIDALPCGWAGLGYIGWERAYSKGTASLSVVGHEFGHNFGLYHAGRLNCGSNVIAATGCTVTEYGDRFNIMGNVRPMHLSAFQKEMLGYISGASIATHSTGSTTYTLGPIELAGQPRYAVRVPTGSSTRTYWLEFRKPIGFDSPLSAYPHNGVQVRLARPFEWNNCGGCSGTYDDTQFLDMSPADGNADNGTLLAGQSYTDSLHNITVDVLTATSTELTLKVSIGASVGSTTTTLASSANPSTLGQSVTFTASVTGSAPTGSVAFRESGTPLTGCGAVALSGSGGTRSATCTSSTLAAGVHSIVAEYSGDAGNSGSSSSPLSQSVKAATTTTLASSSNPSSAGSAVFFTATVNGSAPTGTVAFTANGTTIGSCGAVNLAGSGNSRTAMCATSALGSGMHAIIASYSGNSANGASASAPLSQMVSGGGGGGAAVATKTSVTSSSNPSVAGSPVTLTATVVGDPPIAGGTVTFTANGAPLAGCTGKPLTAAGNVRSANCTQMALASGAYSIVASYGGSASGAPSSSLVYSQVITYPSIGNTLQFARSAFAVNETAGALMVSVTRIGDVSTPAHVGYGVSGGTATPNADFTASAGMLSWSAGDSSPRFVVIPIADDATAEADETFTVTLANPVGATLGSASSATVTIRDDESAPLAMPGIATIVQEPYGALTVQGGTRNGDTISNLQKNAVIQLGALAGVPGSATIIEFQGLSIGAGNTLTIRGGAAGQSIQLIDVGGAASNIAGTLRAEGGNGAAAPQLSLRNAAGVVVVDGGTVSGTAGATVDTLGGSWSSGQPLVNDGNIDGGANLQVFASKVNGGGAFRGNAIVLASFGNLNNPINGAHFLANALQLFPGTGANLDVTLAGYGNAPQIVNLLLNGNATLRMPSAWPSGSTLPANNRPVMPGETRAAGVADPPYGGGSMIVQAIGTLTLNGGAGGNFVFPGGVVLKSGGTLDVRGTTIDNAWTTSGASFQGVFLEAAGITDSSASARIVVRTNNLNWANFSPRPLVPVGTWTLQRMADGTAQLLAADGVAPHLNFFSVTSEAGAAGACFTCLVNTQVIDFSMAP